MPFEISFARSAVRAGILFFLADSAVAGLLRLSRSYGRCASNIELSETLCILITGSAGFIGANLALRILNTIPGVTLVGIDNLNDYYEPQLKEYRLNLISLETAKHPESNYTFVHGSIADKATVDKIFTTFKPSIVINLAAQAGVRYSIDHPEIEEFCILYKKYKRG